MVGSCKGWLKREFRAPKCRCGVAGGFLGRSQLGAGRFLWSGFKAAAGTGVSEWGFQPPRGREGVERWVWKWRWGWRSWERRGDFVGQPEPVGMKAETPRGCGASPPLSTSGAGMQGWEKREVWAVLGEPKLPQGWVLPPSRTLKATIPHLGLCWLLHVRSQLDPSRLEDVTARSGGPVSP